MRRKNRFRNAKRRATDTFDLWITDCVGPAMTSRYGFGTETGMTTGRDIPAAIEQLHALRCVDAVARAGSVRGAAELMHLSQPAVTRAIQGIERSQGAALFERGARGMLPSLIGKRVAARSAALLDHLRRAALDACERREATETRARRFAASVDASSLKALYVVALTGTEVAAGLALRTSQPAIHYALRRLEERSGVQLMHRSLRGSRLTDAGERMLYGIKLAFQEVRALESELAAWRGELHGKVVIGVLPLWIGSVLVQAANVASERHPRVEFSVMEGTYRNLSQQLLSADIDLLVGALRETAPEIEQQPLYTDELAIVARAGHPCLGHRQSLASLARWEWIAPLSGTPASTTFDEVFKAGGVRAPTVSVRSSSSLFIRSAITQSDRLALFLRRQALEDQDSGMLKVVPLRLPSTMRTIGVATRRGASLPPETVELIQALRATSARHQ